MSFVIRTLNVDDAVALKDIRLEMLREVPEAFTVSFAEVQAHPENYWRDSLASERVYFGAYDGSDLIGTVNYLRETMTQTAHRAWLLGMYARPQARGTGCSLKLVETLLEHARSEVIQVHLGVGAQNEPARRLYEKAGFELYGTEPRSLKVNGKFVDEHFMVKMFDKEE